MAITRIKSLPDSVVTEAKVNPATAVNVDVSPSAAIAQSKVSGLGPAITTLNSNISTTNSSITTLDGKL